MATARLSGRRHGGAAGKRTALLLVLACGVLLLVMLNGNVSGKSA